MSTPFAIVGAGGRVGKELVREIVATPQATLVAAFDAEGSASLGHDVASLVGLTPIGVEVRSDFARTLAPAKVVIDFSRPEATAAVAKACADQGVSLVSGTTGLSNEQRETLHAAAKTVAVLWAANMSLGVNVLMLLAAHARKLLGAAYDVEIIEAHHNQKRDAPSGTALRLGELIADALPSTGDPGPPQSTHGRQGLQPRVAGEVGFHAVRGGDLVGEHTVMFCGIGERLELIQRTHSRSNYARGAVRAACWIADQGPGLYDMQDAISSWA